MKSPQPKELGVSWRRMCTAFCKHIDALSGRALNLSPCYCERSEESPTGMKGTRFALFSLTVLMLMTFSARAQQLASPISPAVPGGSPDAAPAPVDEEIVPTYETQKLARTYTLDIPAPRGQITDRNGVPLAQNRLAYNLVINFPTPLDFSDAQALGFARAKIGKAGKLIRREPRISDDAILRHYRNRGIMPLEIAHNLSQEEYEKIKDDLPPGMMVRPVYVRIYPNGKVAGQIIGYTGKTGRNPDGIVDNHET